MQKIPTIFNRDESVKGHPVIDGLKPECEWILEGDVRATQKVDGMNVKVENGQLLKRQKPKDRDYDDASYVPCQRGRPEEKHLWTAFDNSSPVVDGIYEAAGPKIQGNPHGLPESGLFKVVPVTRALDIDVSDRSFEGLKVFLESHDYEGIVFHHPDGRMAKIKRRDYGLSWPTFNLSQ